MLTLEKRLDIHVLVGAEDWKQPTCPPTRAACRFGVLVVVPVKRGKETDLSPRAVCTGLGITAPRFTVLFTRDVRDGERTAVLPLSSVRDSASRVHSLGLWKEDMSESGQGVPAGPATRALAPLLVRAAKPSLQSASRFCVRVTFPPSAGAAQGRKVASAAWCLPLRRVISEVRVIRSTLSSTHVGLDLSWCPGLPHSSKNARAQGWAVVWCPGSCVSVTRVSGPRGGGCPPPLARALSQDPHCRCGVLGWS